MVSWVLLVLVSRVSSVIMWSKAMDREEPIWGWRHAGIGVVRKWELREKRSFPYNITTLAYCSVGSTRC